MTLFNKIRNNEKKELDRKTEAFKKDYEQLVQKHRMYWQPVLDYQPDGIYARIAVVPLPNSSEIVKPESGIVNPFGK